MASFALQRSKALLEEAGYHVWIVEVWNSWAHIRIDLYNLADLVAIRHDQPGVLGINCCEDNGEVQGHVDKYLKGYTVQSGKNAGKTFPPNPHLPVWLAAGNKFEIHGWGKRGAKDKRKLWALRKVAFFLNPQSSVDWSEVP